MEEMQAILPPTGITLASRNQNTKPEKKQKFINNPTIIVEDQKNYFGRSYLNNEIIVSLNSTMDNTEETKLCKKHVNSAKDLRSFQSQTKSEKSNHLLPQMLPEENLQHLKLQENSKEISKCLQSRFTYDGNSKHLHLLSNYTQEFRSIQRRTLSKENLEEEHLPLRSKTKENFKLLPLKDTNKTKDNFRRQFFSPSKSKQNDLRNTQNVLTQQIVKVLLGFLLLNYSQRAVLVAADEPKFAEYKIVPTPVPEEYYSEQPINQTVPEGDIAIMKCKSYGPVEHCRWFYTKLDQDFYDDSNEAKLVKDFKPSKNNDCSIRFTKVRKVQEGQWLCQARKFMSATFYNTRPAMLRVITESEEKDFEDRFSPGTGLSSSEENNRTFVSPPPNGGHTRIPPLSIVPLNPTRSPLGPGNIPAPPRLPPVSRRGPSVPNTPRGFNPRGTGTSNTPRGFNAPNSPTGPGRNFSGPRDPTNTVRQRGNAPRDPTAPTAIPALGPPHPGPLPPPFHPSRTGPGDVLRPSPYNPQFERRPGPSIPDEEANLKPKFTYFSDDHIQNTRTGGSATLPCKVDRAVASCTWIMPNNALFVWSEADSSVGRSLSINTPISPSDGASPSPKKEYEFVGNRDLGNCSLTVHNVKHHDEGNWRCVVSVPRPRRPSHRTFGSGEDNVELDVQGPLIHLHLLDYNHGVHLKDGPNTTMSPGANVTLIILFLVGLILFAVGAIIIYCCYKKVWSKPDENTKIMQTSPRNSEVEYSQQWFQGRNLKIVDPNYTDDFKMRNIKGGTEYMIHKVDTSNLKNPNVQYSDIDHYNQYLSMTQGGPGSVRSSASSNTTLSTVAADPLGRDRSLSFVTSPNMSPIHMHNAMANHPHPHPGHMVTPNGTIIPGPPQGNVDNVSFYEVHRKLQRPVSLYSTGHLYEEIQEKIPFNPMGQQHVINSQGILVTAPGIPQGQMATTPVYTNVVEDHDGYLIPNKSNKIVNTPTGDEDPSQYLPMTRELTEIEQRKLNEMQYRQQNVHIHNMNDLSFHQAPTSHIQFFDAASQQQHTLAMAQAQLNEASNRRYSNDSQLSVELNNPNEYDQPNQLPKSSTPTKDTRDPNLNSTSPTKPQNHKTPSTTPNTRRQRMPLPSTPTNTTHPAQNTEPPKQQSPKSTNAKPQLNLQLSNAKSPSSSSGGGGGGGGGGPQPNQSSLHQRTSSLPDTSIIGAVGKVSHAKSPSLVPTAETYDVPRSIGEVPATVNGSEISLDDIDGTIV